MPIGVVIGPLSAILFALIDASVSSGSGVPAVSITSTPASRTSQSNATPVASSTRRVASVSSGPVPSPGMSVTRCAMPRASVHVHPFGSIGARDRAATPRSFDTELVEGTAAVVPLPAVRRPDVTVLRQEARCGARACRVARRREQMAGLRRRAGARPRAGDVCARPRAPSPALRGVGAHVSRRDRLRRRAV